MTFETPRLLLRPHRIEDFDRYWQMICDPVGRRFAGGVTALAYDARQALFLRDLGKMECAVVEKSSGLYIGYCGLRGRELIFGYLREAWGRGYATEAARGVLAALLPGEVFATVERENTASARVLQKLGFQFLRAEGTIDRYMRPA